MCVDRYENLINELADLRLSITGMSPSNQSVGYSMFENSLHELEVLVGPACVDELRQRLRNVIDRKRDNNLRAVNNESHHQLRVHPLAIVSQRPVGHGGFHVGALGAECPSVRWVYDCGAWRTAGKMALRREVDRFHALLGAENRLDLLFISHFDADHVDGLDLLLKWGRPEPLQVDTVVMPYLQPADALVVGAAADRMTANLIQIITKPEEWAAQRGVRRLVRLRPDEGEGTVGLPLHPEGPILAPSVEEDREFWPVLIGPFGQAFPPPQAGLTEVVDAAPGTSVQIASTTGWTDWWFAPHVHGLTPMLRVALAMEVDNMLRTHANAADCMECIISTLTDPQRRRRLREAYKRSNLRDSNAISMSLYLGPHNVGRLLLATERDSEAHRGVHRNPGWILTGDAVLNHSRRRQRWLEFCQKIGTNHLAGTLMLPHHGAAGRYFNEEILNAAPALRLFLTLGSSDESRPHPDIKDALSKLHYPDPIEINEKSKSGLRDVSGPELMDSWAVTADHLASWT